MEEEKKDYKSVDEFASEKKKYMRKQTDDWQIKNRQSQLRLRGHKKQDTAERIYRAALRLFRERGYAATTIDEIAQAAGVANGTFFSYYPIKDAVLSHFGRQQMRLVEEAIAMLPYFETIPAYGQILFVFNLLAAGAQGDREVLRIIIHQIFNSAFAFSDTSSSAHQLYELVLEMVRRGQERGELQTTAMAEAMTLILLSTYFYTFINWLEMENPPQLSQMLQTHLNVLLDGMKPSRSRSGQSNPNSFALITPCV